MPCRVVVARHDQLQHRQRCIVKRYLGDERLRRVGKHSADAEVPVAFDPFDKPRQILQPTSGANCNRLASNHRGNLDHTTTFADLGSRLHPDCQPGREMLSTP